MFRSMGSASVVVVVAGAAVVVAGAAVGGWAVGVPLRPHAAPAAAPPTAAAASQPALPATRPAESRVTIDHFAYDPRVVTVAPGTRVTWVNRDDVPHTATATGSPRAFASPPLDTDDTFSHVFDRPGTYPYFCAVHPHMTATVVVR